MTDRYMLVCADDENYHNQITSFHDTKEDMCRQIKLTPHGYSVIGSWKHEDITIEDRVNAEQDKGVKQ